MNLSRKRWKNYGSEGVRFSWLPSSSMGNFGLALTIAGTGLFLVMSLRRYLRYWLVRLIYEQRDQTDRIVNK